MVIAPVTMPGERPVVVIDGALGDPAGWRELWEYRDLLILFVRREIQLRYRDTVMGFAWAVLQPLLIMVALSVFASMVGVKTGGTPYPLFAISGLVPWTYFVHALTKTTHSLLAQSGTLTQIYFPRLLVPVAAAAGGAMDFLAAALLLPVFMLCYGVRPGLPLLALPIFILMALAAALGLGLWLAVLNVRYKDIGNALPFFTQLLFFATPIAYPASLISPSWRLIAGLNPMTGVIEGFRWALLGDTGAAHGPVLVSTGVIVLLLAGGVWFFRRREAALIDEM